MNHLEKSILKIVESCDPNIEYVISDCDGVILSWFSKIREFLESENLPSGHIDELFKEGKGSFFDIVDLFPFDDGDGVEATAYRLMTKYNKSEFMSKLDIYEKGSERALQNISKEYGLIIVTNLTEDEKGIQNRLDNIAACTGVLPDGIISMPPRTNKYEALKMLSEKLNCIMYIDDAAEHVQQSLDAGIKNSRQFVKDISEHRRSKSLMHFDGWEDIENYLNSEHGKSQNKKMAS